MNNSDILYTFISYLYTKKPNIYIHIMQNNYKTYSLLENILVVDPSSRYHSILLFIFFTFQSFNLCRLHITVLTSVRHAEWSHNSNTITKIWPYQGRRVKFDSLFVSSTYIFRFSPLTYRQMPFNNGRVSFKFKICKKSAFRNGM